MQQKKIVKWSKNLVCIFTRSYYVNELRLLKFGKRRIMRQIREELIPVLDSYWKKRKLEHIFLTECAT